MTMPTREEISRYADAYNGLGVAYLLRRIADALDGYDAAEQDSRRFIWWFTSTKDNNYVNEYLHGMREGYSLSQWRESIDAAMLAAANKENGHD